MKQLLIASALILASFLGYSQTVKKDANGNLYAVKAPKDSTGGKKTSILFTDTDGTVYPVMKSKNGKLFVVRTSKTGRVYNQYLKVTE